MSDTIKIEITQPDRKVTLELPLDTNVEDMASAIRDLLPALGYYKGQLEERLCELLKAAQ